MTVGEAIHGFLAELQKDTESRARKKYSWQTAYENAMSETDPAKRPAQIAFAETIMYARQTSLVGDPNAFEERKALQTAITRVRSK
jgi:hypothetical protein